MGTFQRLTGIGLCFGALAVASTTAPAQLVVDSSQTANNYGFFVTSPTAAPGQLPRWQQFVPAHDNLERMDLWIEDQHRVDSVLTVWITDSSQTTLWSAGIPDAALPSNGWLVIDTPRISVVPGSAYRVNVTVDKFPNDPNNPAGSVYWMGSTVPTAYYLNDTSSDWPTFSYCLITYAVVPEPGVLVLLAVGVPLLLARRESTRRRELKQ